MTLKPWKWSLPTQIFVGLLIGAVAGIIANKTTGNSESLGWTIQNVTQPIGNIFLRLIFMMVIPLIISAIVLGIAEMGDLRKLGRVGIRCLVLTLGLASTSVLIGLLLVNWIKPGNHVSAEKRSELVAQYSSAASKTVELAAQKKPLADTLIDLIPKSPVGEAARAFDSNYTGGGILAVMVFSLFVGLAIAVSEQEKVRALVAVLSGLFTVSLKVIGFAMRIAPLCVACLVFSVAARLGFDVVHTLGIYIVVVVLGLAIHQFLTYPVVLLLFSRMKPWTFFRQIEEVMVTAFSTSSSNATLPVSLRVAEQNLRLPPQISRFVLTVGASANQNGTALYEGVTVLFLAQVFGVELTVVQQLTVAFMCVLAGIGTAGVPGGSLPLVVGVLISVGIPGESIALILGVDRLLDMCRTTLNVTGDLVCAVVIADRESAASAS